MNRIVTSALACCLLTALAAAPALANGDDGVPGNGALQIGGQRAANEGVAAAAQARLVQLRLDAERAAVRDAKKKADEERQIAEEAAKMKAAQDKADHDAADQDKATKDKAEREKADRDKAEREKADRDKADRDKADRDKADRDRADRDKAERDRADRDTAERDRAEKDKAERDRAERDTAEREKAHNGNDQAKLDLEHIRKSERDNHGDNDDNLCKLASLALGGCSGEDDQEHKGDDDKYDNDHLAGHHDDDGGACSLLSLSRCHEEKDGEHHGDDDHYGDGGGHHLPGDHGPDSPPPGPHTPVPEPASWMMMIIGCGAAGTMLRSRRRRVAGVS